MKTVASDWREQRIELPERMTFLPYYTTSPWSVGEEYFIFFSAGRGFSGIRLHAWSPAEEQIVAEVELSGWNGLPEPVAGEELLSAVFLQGSECLLLPRGADLYRVALRSGSVELVYRHPERTMRLGGPGSRSRDGKFAAFGAYYPVTGTPELTDLIVLDTSGFRLKARHEFQNFHANHFQFQLDSDWILFAHEGATETIADRMNRINWKTGVRQLLHRHETAPDGTLLECIGHEMSGENIVCAVRYPVSVLPGALVTMNPDGSDYTVLDCDDYWHCSCNADGTVFAMDTMWWGKSKRRTPFVPDIIRIDRRAGTKEIIKTIHANPVAQHRHPHPQLNAAGNRLLFIEDSHSDPAFGSITFRELF